MFINCVRTGSIRSLLQLPRQASSSHSLASNRALPRFLSLSKKYSTATAETTVDAKPSPTLPSEKIIGSASKFEFKTETHKLLDIVANSLYSEKEVFIRELISNAADATEKLRHRQLAEPDQLEASDNSLEIHLNIDKEKKTFSIQDFGIGMTESELHENLGTIARSGSKNFVEQLKQGSEQGSAAKDRIIGQFGVGFYSAFMVGRPIQVFTKSSTKGSKGYCWISDGQGSYEISEAENVAVGTKIVIHLHDDSFINEQKVKGVIKKYSNFVGFPIKLNNEVVNELEPLWTKSPGQITKEEHRKFYQYVSNSYDEPRFSLVYKTDAPLSIRSILYIPERANDFLGAQKSSTGVHLYSRNVMIQNQCNQLLPNWLRFVSGVVDSEDVPLNLSREILQNGRLISSLRRVLTTRIIKWLKDEAKKDVEKFNKFYSGFHRYFKEGAILDENQTDRGDVIPLLRFASSGLKTNELTTLNDYVSRIHKDQKSIFYLCRPRSEMENNPYYEPFKKNNIEVLALDDTVDKVLVNTIKEYKDLPLVDIESSKAADEVAALYPETDVPSDRLDNTQARELGDWMLNKFSSKLSIPKVEIATRSSSFPALVKDHHNENDPYMREFLKQALGQGESLPMVQAEIEINPFHPIIAGLYMLKTSSPDLAEKIAEQIICNARLTAGLLDDKQMMLTHLNTLLAELVVAKLPETPFNSTSKVDSVSEANFKPASETVSEASPESVLESSPESEIKNSKN